MKHFYRKQHKLQKLTHHEIDNLNNCIAIKEIDFIVLKFTKEKHTSLDCFTGELSWSCKSNTNSVQYIPKTKKGTPPNLYYEANFIWIPEWKATQERKTTDQCSLRL